MKITKEVNIAEDKARIIIELGRPIGYEGFDVFPDHMLSALFIAVTRLVQDSSNKLKRLYSGGNSNRSKQ